MMAWQSGTLCSVEFRDQPLTGKRSLLPIQFSQGSAFTPWNSSSKLRAGKVPSRICTRSAQRRPMLARASSSGPPENSTRPFSTRTSPASIRLSSSPTIPSMPIRQGAQYRHMSMISRFLRLIRFF